MIDLVIHLRSGQELGPSLQFDHVMVLKRRERAMRGLVMTDGWMDEGKKAFSILAGRSRVFRTKP